MDRGRGRDLVHWILHLLMVVTWTKDMDRETQLLNVLPAPLSLIQTEGSSYLQVPLRLTGRKVWLLQ